MSDHKRRFRPRPQRSGFRPRSNGGQNSNGHFQSNGNISRNNGSMTNPYNVEKAVQKYQQLAKDALTSGDPVSHENYLQHAEHYNRRLAELNVRPTEIKTESSNSSKQETTPSVEKKEAI